MWEKIIAAGNTRELKKTKSLQLKNPRIQTNCQGKLYA